MQIDENFLEELGLGALSAEDKQKYLNAINETLEIRIGSRLTTQLNEDQLEQFNAMVDSDNDADLDKWLEDNAPNYNEIVAEELEMIKTEIREQGPAALSSQDETANA